MTSIGIGGLVVGNAGAGEPAQAYVSGKDSETGISPVSPVSPLEKSSTTPSQSQPHTSDPGSKTPEFDQSVPSSPRAIEESASGSTSPIPTGPTHVPSQPRPTGSPSESPSDPGESPSDPSESPTESPSDPSDPPSDPSDPPSDPSDPPSESETVEPGPSASE